MAIFKKLEGDELYLYMNGNLIYKRWLKEGYSKVFDVMAYDKYTLTSYKDIHFESPGGVIPVRAKVKMKTTAEGGRINGFVSGYRPNHVFEYNAYSYIGDIIFEGQETVEPGEEKEVIVRFWIEQRIEEFLDRGRKWWIQEGSRVVGEAEVL